MKNIHVLPTDKPSRLFKHNNAFFIEKEFYESTPRVISQNIYITSDEEIIDLRPHKGKWHLEKEQILNKFPDYLTDLSECKLIILTTDQDLIKEGVQAIDDEFLEWFVKNPSCEEVEIVSAKTIPALQLTGNGHCWWKIIIPKEETNGCIGINGVSDPKLNEVQLNQSKQETLEEAKKYLSNEGYGKGSNFTLNNVANLMIEWQQEQDKKMYSEEQMDNAYDKGFKDASERSYSEEDLKEAFYQGWVLSGAGVSFREAIDKWFKHLKNK